VSGRLVTTPVFALLLAVAVAPGRARADRLPDLELTFPEQAPAVELALADEGSLTLVVPEHPQPDLHAAPPGLRVALASAKQKPADASSLDFDLLGDAPKPKLAAEDPSLKTRRSMLNLHQGLGLGLLGLQVASTVTGQLNYSDKFGTANTGRYKATHQVLVYSNLAAFAVVGGIALFAPTEKNAPPRPFGRTTIHKIGMALATAGMLSQGVLGVRTAQREGYLDKQTYGRAHLAVGYATLAAMCVAVGAIVF
jgi:hypothetical protein